MVLIHGGGNSTAGTYSLGRMTAAPTANFLAQGWAVYSIDFRPQSPFKPIEWDDACRAVATLRAMPFIDAKRIAMMGGSHGGYNTARVAARCDLSCAIPCAAAAIDPIEVAKAQKAGEAVNSRAMDAIRKQAEGYGMRLEELSAKPPPDYNTPLTEVAKVRCPLLLVSGRDDSSSPPSVMETYAAKLRAAGKEVELYLPDHGPHGFYFGNPRIPETDECARRAVVFIAKHFGVATKSSAPAASSQSVSPAPKSAPKAAPDGRAAQLFQRLDANRDGKIDGAEAASEPGRRFVQMFDKNGDGVVTREEAALENAKPSAPSTAPQKPQADASTAASDLAVTVSDKTMTSMSSPWAEYFGTHYARSPDEAGKTWNTVREYGGAHVGIQAENPGAPPRKGPFTGREVRITLEDFHGARSAGQLIPELIEHRLTGIYLMNNIVSPSLEPFDKDLAYWAVRQIHEQFPEAHRQVVWQMGNEVVSGHFDPKGVWGRRRGAEPGPGQRPEQREDNFFGYDLKWKEDYYVNDFLAPAIEATERASRDVYGDSRKIQIALGSMNPYNPQNLAFLKNVMSRTFDGRQAPTLKGEPVWKHIDLLTVHYMTGSPRNIETLQQYHDDYLKTGKIKGIWITEDHGHAGKGPVTILDRGLRFLNWAARNNLSGAQTRLCWWGEGEREPGGSGNEATRLLGGFLAGRPLHFLHRQEGDASIYVLTDANDAKLSRGLVAIVPERFGTLDCGKLTVALPPGATAKNWAARTVRYSLENPPQVSPAVLSRSGDALIVPLNQPVSGVWMLMLADDPSALPHSTHP